MIRFITTFILGLSLVARAETTTNLSSVTYSCVKVGERAIVIDGNLNDKAWAKAAVMENLQTAGPKPVPAKYLSKARLLWSDKRLFLAFECKIDAIRSTMTRRDDDIWNEECAELYLCPRGSEAKYYEIDFNPQNAIYDSMLHSYKYQEQVKHYKEWALAYNAKVESKTKVLKDADGKVTGWILEAAIPFSDLAEANHVPPLTGDAWWFNVFRIAQIGEKECEYSAWVPTLADFHKPWMFPRLRFVDAK
jgi:hypothetical protein